MANFLKNESSPYLLQHADNPVAWYPWGDEALEKARREDKPILLSIGYAACHWCHVMAHESFEDEETAALMNRSFVNIKVDREERPDLDSIYMNAVVAMTGQGGWPMTVFLTPDGHPFYGGTYYPPAPRFGMPSFRQVLQSVATAWETKRADIVDNAAQMTAHLGRSLRLAAGQTGLDQSMLDEALRALKKSYDNRHGGWGQAPKFPQAMTIEFLLRVFLENEDQEALSMAEHTLERMAGGGMYDQIGGGFARYSTDNHWLVPHFEKMLYDNALLARVYLHAWQLTGRESYRRVVEETLDWVVAEMRHRQGGFYSSMDADSEGEEGKFYVWQLQEVDDSLQPDEAQLVIRHYGVGEGGNWEGKNILHVAEELTSVASDMGIELSEARAMLAKARQKLYEVRSSREWPGIDDKVLTAWNGLMLAAFAEAGRVLQRDDYVDVAIENAHFLYETMRSAQGRLWRTWREGSEAHYNGYLEDYVYLADGLLALYQTVFDERWYVWAQELMQIVVAHFRDANAGGFYDTSDDHEDLIHRPKDVQDNAVPSGNAMAVHVLLMLSLYSGKDEMWSLAEEALSGMRDAMVQYPTGFAHWLTAATLALGEPQEVAIRGEPRAEDTHSLLQIVRSRYRPHVIVAVGNGSASIPLLENRARRDGQATAYVCRRFVCRQPVTSPEALAEQLGDKG